MEDVLEELKGQRVVVKDVVCDTFVSSMTVKTENGTEYIIGPGSVSDSQYLSCYEKKEAEEREDDFRDCDTYPNVVKITWYGPHSPPRLDFKDGSFKMLDACHTFTGHTSIKKIDNSFNKSEVFFDPPVVAQKTGLKLHAY